jgi:hypothetical protein
MYAECWWGGTIYVPKVLEKNMGKEMKKDNIKMNRTQAMY